MKKQRLFTLNVMALCCLMGLLTKKMMNPLANVITEALHIPGGISTGFSIMFLVIAAELIQTPRCGVMMGTVQGLLALIMGRVGSMGLFSPIGYIMPGLAIDLVYCLCRSPLISRTDRMVLANGLAAVAASVTANLIVFHLQGPVLWLYLCISATSGSLYGILGAAIAARIGNVYGQYQNNVRSLTYENA